MTTTVDAPAAIGPQPASDRLGVLRRHSDRIGSVLLMLATAVLYLWNIAVNGMGNQFYAGAAWAGSKDWEALLFGSLDPNNFITVDKPPVSQWVMGLSGQLFGFSSTSMLVPQALMAVASVGLVHGSIRRVTGSHWAGLLGGAALAVTPVAALMFRFNNPDAVMVLLMTAGAYATVRALPRASTLWIVLAGVALGFAFLAKMLEGLMVMPALGLAFLIAAPTPLRRRLVQLAGALAALVVSSGWYVALTLLWPASARPYLAGSTDNNFMNLVLGYNGFARVLGRNHSGEPTPPTPDPAHAAQLPQNGPGAHDFGGFGSQTHGVTRMFTGEFGFEISWLLPAALLAFVLVLISRGRAPRTDLVRAGAIVFGLWMIIDGGVLSYMNGTVHAYYSMSIAPAVASMFALGCWELWRNRTALVGRLGLPLLVAATGVWGFVLLQRNRDWHPELRWLVLISMLLAAAALSAAFFARSSESRARLAVAALVLGLAGGSAGPAAYSVATVATAHTGGSPTVGPAQSGGDHGGFADGAGQSNPQLIALLAGSNAEWAAAVNGSSAAAGLELQSDKAVMAIGGFSGSDPTPTLAEFQAEVKANRIGYYIVQQGRGNAPGGNAPSAAPGTHNDRPGTQQNGGNPDPAAQPNNIGWGGGRDSRHAEISDWVSATFTPRQIGNATVYDLSGHQG